MLLENFIKSMFGGLAVSNTVKSSSGQIASFAQLSSSAPFTSYDNTSTRSASMYYGGIALGSDDTPPTYSDYQIKSPITTGLVNLSYGNEKAGLTLTLTQTVRNDTSDTITVKEIGIFATGSSSSPSDYCKILYTRSVVNVPIEPNEVKTFTISIDYSKFSDAYSAT